MRVESCERWIVTGEADIIAKRVEPDIGDEVFVKRQLDPPIQSRFRARDAEIAAQSLNRVAQFGLTKVRNDRVFAIFEIVAEPFLMVT